MYVPGRKHSLISILQNVPFNAWFDNICTEIKNSGYLSCRSMRDLKIFVPNTYRGFHKYQSVHSRNILNLECMYLPHVCTWRLFTLCTNINSTPHPMYVAEKLFTLGRFTPISPPIQINTKNSKYHFGTAFINSKFHQEQNATIPKIPPIRHTD